MTRRAPLAFCMLCAELGLVRSATMDARLRNRHDRAYLCEMHYRTHANGVGRPVK